MKGWVRGKGVGLATFAGIAILVTGGLGWATFAALRLERAQLESRAEADIRLALWRLDSRIFTDLAKIANQPLQDFSLSLVPETKNGSGKPDTVLLTLEPAAAAERLPWVQGYFVMARRSDWPSAAALTRSWKQGLSLEDRKIPPELSDSSKMEFVAELARDAVLRQMLTQTDPQTVQAAGIPSGQMLNQAPQAGDLPNASANASDVQNLFPQQVGGRDATLRRSRAQLEIGQQVVGPNSSPLGNNYAPPAGPKPPLAILGAMVPVWAGSEAEKRLVMTRQIQVGEKLACQVTLLDWPMLRGLLEEEAHDLLPEVRLNPVQEGNALNPDRAMTALPVALEPGRRTAQEAGLSLNPLRVGLFLSWFAALAALAAVGLGGWSLLNLSESRIRFVSAVTHELRTPLTTLRLYLDMLATGMVRDEIRRDEYIQTLNLEADRLNRLVSNVLDFSRLENQRPRLEKTAIPLSQLLAQVRETWEGRCRNAGKELVIDNGFSSEVMLVTDVQMVSQILGNLIDNACKYSQGAEDTHIWVRARESAARRLSLEVEDRGVGVGREEQRLIFQPFRRGRNDQVPSGGVGLGLALAKRWAALLGGKLELGETQGNVGACFRVDLPLHG